MVTDTVPVPSAQRASPQGWGREAESAACCTFPTSLLLGGRLCPLCHGDVVLPVPGQLATSAEAPHSLPLTPGMSPELPLLLSLDLPNVLFGLDLFFCNVL